MFLIEVREQQNRFYKEREKKLEFAEGVFLERVELWVSGLSPPRLGRVGLLSLPSSQVESAPVGPSMT